MPVAHGRVALVTGSSRGLGAAIARRLAEDGLAVVVNGRRGDEQAEQVARTIRGDGGVADAFGADVTDEQQVVELVAAVSFLASDGAGFITGQRIVVDGGRSLGS
jgi:3-oxoacyl-[acyl-carrier protein] reductase